RRRRSRALPPTPSRSRCRTQSRAQARCGASRLAVAGRSDRSPLAQAQYLVRVARLVAEISHCRAQTRDPTSAQGSHPVRGRLSAFLLRAFGQGLAREGYPPQVLEQVFFANAERFLPEVGFKGRI